MLRIAWSPPASRLAHWYTFQRHSVFLFTIFRFGQLRLLIQPNDQNLLNGPLDLFLILFHWRRCLTALAYELTNDTALCGPLLPVPPDLPALRSLIPFIYDWPAHSMGCVHRFSWQGLEDRPTQSNSALNRKRRGVATASLPCGNHLNGTALPLSIPTETVQG